MRNGKLDEQTHATMKDYIRAGNRYDPNGDTTYNLSRSRLEIFLRCPRCFYLDRRLGVDRVKGPAFTLNSATDTLLKKEFDVFRRRGEAHPLMVKHGIDAVPFEHASLDKWRENFHGVRHLHEPTNLLVFGAVDDLWRNCNGALHVVDYKSTSTSKEISLDDAWKKAYKRQMEIYQWLLRQEGFSVSDTGYFVYVNARTDLDGFHGRLEFKTQLIPYVGKADWVEQAVRDAKRALDRPAPPAPDPECEWCAYRAAADKVLAECRRTSEGGTG